ncbi:MAG: transposase [Nitrospirota bacterium]|nr:transposase [Nitrospirota bacterium]
MPRANRHYLPGYVWHITHRCHKQEFLLKFARDRRRWLHWLFEARKRHGLCVLNYTVTSNHVHLLVRDNGTADVIPAAMQLIAGRMAQEYNNRKERKGAYWEDRYHATAIETDQHLARCLVYMDLNMVRAGVVKHPSEWPHGGYTEIQTPPQRYAIIDRAALKELLTIRSDAELAATHRSWVEEALSKHNSLRREGKWTESIAVGREPFVVATQAKLGIKGPGRVSDTDGHYELRESSSSYMTILGHENDGLRLQNGYFWNDLDDKSVG